MWIAPILDKSTHFARKALQIWRVITIAVRWGLSDGLPCGPWSPSPPTPTGPHVAASQRFATTPDGSEGVHLPLPTSSTSSLSRRRSAMPRRYAASETRGRCWGPRGDHTSCALANAPHVTTLICDHLHAARAGESPTATSWGSSAAWPCAAPECSNPTDCQQPSAIYGAALASVPTSTTVTHEFTPKWSVEAVTIADFGSRRPWLGRSTPRPSFVGPRHRVTMAQVTAALTATSHMPAHPRHRPHVPDHDPDQPSRVVAPPEKRTVILDAATLLMPPVTP